MSSVNTTVATEKSFGEKAAILVFAVGPLVATLYAIVLL
jgi:hypothetical protein